MGSLVYLHLHLQLDYQVWSIFTCTFVYLCAESPHWCQTRVLAVQLSASSWAPRCLTTAARRHHQALLLSPSTPTAAHCRASSDPTVGTLLPLLFRIMCCMSAHTNVLVPPFMTGSAVARYFLCRCCGVSAACLPSQCETHAETFRVMIV